MKVLILIAILILMWCSVIFRTIVLNPLKSLIYSIRDLFLYFKYKKWNSVPQVGLVCYQGLFGKGKTLSAVHDIVKIYKRFNNKPIYDMDSKKWKTQKVQVVSNVDLSIPFIRFESLQQLIDIAKNQSVIDEELNIVTYTIVLGDEFSVQMNSRNFKTNIDPLFLNTLLTSRHYHISHFFYTSQRFNLTDKLLRDVTQYVVDCDKCWRFMVSKRFDAWVIENCANVLNVRPLMRYGWFITNKDFNNYNTLACVDNLIHEVKEGNMISEEEILALQSSMPSDMDSVSRPSRRFKKRHKK